MGRKTIAPGIYADAYGFELRVKRGGKPFSQRAPKGLTRAELITRRTLFLAKVLSTEPTAQPIGTLTRDIERYIAMAKHLANWQKQRSHLRAFVPTLGTKPRALITRPMILELRSQWAESGVKPATINNRLSALRSLYHALDGPDALTPADRIPKMPTHRTPPQRIDPALIVSVDRRLQEQEQRGYLHSPKTRARFRVLATTGARPSEVMRAQAVDLDLAHRVWRVRDGKGGFRPVGLPLTSEAVAAWELFITADAWGPFNTNSFVRRLRYSGWPKGVRPYQLRHTIGLSLSEADVDLADVGSLLGHQPGSRITSRHYVGPQWRRMQNAMNKIEGRVSWDSLPPGSTTRPASTALNFVQNRGVRRGSVDGVKQAKPAKDSRK